MLAAHFEKLELAEKSRVFVPLCGKSLDMVWLLSHGYRVAGAELSTLAVEQFFTEQELQPTIVSEENGITHFRADALDIYCGDLFQLTPERLGKVQAIYNRAALVALPEEMRRKYTEHLCRLTQSAPQLLISFEYDQSQMDGPPFSVPPGAVREYYRGVYQAIMIEDNALDYLLKGRMQAQEQAWVLKSCFLR